MNPLDQAKTLFYRALELHGREQLPQAEVVYREALALAPERVSILANLGAVVVRDGRYEEAQQLAQRALQLEPDCPVALAVLAEIERSHKGPAAALATVGRALSGNPNEPDLLLHSSAMRAELGQFADAFDDCERALVLRPAHVPSRLQRALLNLDLGRFQAALDELQALLQQDPRFLPAGEAWVKLLNTLEPGDALLQRVQPALMVRALDTPWAPIRQLLALACRLLQAEPKLAAWLQRIETAWPQRLPDYSLADLRLAPAVLDSALLRALLRQPALPDASLQHLLANLRAWLLARASAAKTHGESPQLLAFHCALAAHCSRSQHVYPLLEGERTSLLQLRHRMLLALNAGQPIAPGWLPAVASYLPLAGLRDAQRLRERAWPTPVQALLNSALIAPTPLLPALRWNRGSVSPRAISLADYLLECRVPLGGFRLPSVPDPRVLALAAGAGEWAIELAVRVLGAKVLALDPDSDCAAACREQAHQLRLPQLRCEVGALAAAGAGGYTVIDSGRSLLMTGAAAPQLLELKRWLAPRGLLRIRIASSRLRQALRAARVYLGAFPAGASTELLREARELLLALPPTDPARSLSRLAEFHALGSCRSLLAEFDDSPLDLDGLSALLQAAGLKFRALEFGPVERSALSPERALPADLRAWAEFEAAHPQTFSGYYAVWVGLA